MMFMILTFIVIFAVLFVFTVAVSGEITAPAIIAAIFSFFLTLFGYYFVQTDKKQIVPITEYKVFVDDTRGVGYLIYNGQMKEFKEYSDVKYLMDLKPPTPIFLKREMSRRGFILRETVSWKEESIEK